MSIVPAHEPAGGLLWSLRHHVQMRAPRDSASRRRVRSAVQSSEHGVGGGFVSYIDYTERICMVSRLTWSSTLGGVVLTRRGVTCNGSLNAA